MKKLAAAILISLLLFNWVGYRLVVDYLQQKSDTHLDASLDQNQYDDSQLIQLKIPVDLAYQNSSSSFERCYGEIEMNGTLYKYVKRKVSNDTLYLKCIPNTTKMNLEAARDDFFKSTNDLQNNNSKSNNSKSSVFKSLMSEYDGYSFAIDLTSSNKYSKSYFFTYQVNNLLSSPHVSPEQPPDLLPAV